MKITKMNKEKDHIYFELEDKKKSYYVKKKEDEITGFILSGFLLKEIDEEQREEITQFLKRQKDRINLTSVFNRDDTLPGFYRVNKRFFEATGQTFKTSNKQKFFRRQTETRERGKSE